jgi:hypothetical protein
MVRVNVERCHRNGSPGAREDAKTIIGFPIFKPLVVIYLTIPKYVGRNIPACWNEGDLLAREPSQPLILLRVRTRAFLVASSAIFLLRVLA